MTFAELRPGELARIPRTHAVLGELSPVVRVEAGMHQCADGLCPCLVVSTRDIETGLSRPYHRPANFAVVVITPAKESS